MNGSLSGTETNDQSLYLFSEYKTRKDKTVVIVIGASKVSEFAHERNVALVGGRVVRCVSF